MKKLFTLFAVLFLVLFFSSNSFAQVTVSGALVGDGSYATLGAAFTAINGGAQTGANIVITITGNTSEGATTATLGAGTWATVTISPSGSWTISGATTAGFPMIDFAGSDNVTINGINSLGNSLTISNTTVSATSGTSTIRYITDATNNTITNCTVLGSSTMAVGTNGGNIYYATGTTTGNDNNTVSFCNIGPAGLNLPTKGVYGNGSTTTTTHYNSGININNCNIYDYFGASVQSAGIYVAGGCTDWTINNNRFYQTATRTQVTTGSIHAGIQLASANINNCTITNNIIGYSSSAGTGTYTFVGVTTGSRFYPIYLSSHGTTTATSIQGNTVTAINVSGPVGGTSTSAPFAGILVSSGLANIGNVTGNTIGSTTVSGSISFSSSSISSSDIYGIYYFPSAVSNISNNNIGGFTLNTTSTGNAVFYGLRAFTTSTVTNTFANNTVGYSAAPITNNSTVITSRVIGIYSQSGNPNVTGNTVRNMSMVAVNTSTASASSVIGIWISATGTSLAGVVSQNTVHTLSNTGAGAISVVGMYCNMTALVSTALVTKNFIHSLSASSTTATIQGLYTDAGNTTYANNMVRLGIDASGANITTALIIYGILETGGSNNFYHNSLYLGGTGVGTTANNTIALNSTVVTNTRSYINNLIQNSRSNATTGGPHYGIRLSGTGPNPTGLTTNYNVVYTNGTGGAFGFYNAATATLSDWQTATGQDANSISGFDPQYINPTGSSSTLDLHIHPTNATPVEGNGTNIAAITDDYDGQTRGTLTPVDIGADAGNFVALPVMTYVSSTTTQTNVNPVGPGATNAEIIGIQVVTTGVTSPINLTALTLNTNGSTNAPGDLTNAKVWYTGTSSTFATTTQFGSTFVGPNGSFSVTGTRQLATGTNYFWVTYDVNAGATIGNFIDAECNDLTGSGSMGTQIPSVQAPFGNRQILSPLSGTYTVGSNFGDNYLSLTGTGGVFEIINNVGLQGNVILQITTDINEAGTNALNQWSEIGAGNYTIRIVPASASEKTVSGNVANAMVRFNGSDRVTVDGNNGLDAGTKYLRFRNTNGSNPTFLFINDATNNTITNCYVESNNTNTTATSAATILFSTTTGTTGNDNNTISDCDIRDNSDASGSPFAAILCNGSATTTSTYNSNISITGCNIFNWWAPTTTGAYGVYVFANGTDWTVTGNHFYQTATRTTTITSNFSAIIITTSVANNMNVSSNFIGGSAPNCAGSPLSFLSGASGVTNSFYPVRFSLAGTTTASSVNSNTVRNIAVSVDAPTTAGTLWFDAMLLQAGAINVTNNTIGSQSANDDIVLTVNNGTVTFAMFGIDMRGASGSVTGNTVGGMTVNGTNPALSIVVGINEGSTVTSAINVTNNTIGGTVSNSIQDTRVTAGSQMTGIRSSQAGLFTANYTGNTIRNMTDAGNLGGFLAGISHSGSTSLLIDNNTINNLNSGSSLAGGFSGTHTMCGISLTGTGTLQSISNNTIFNINNTYTGINTTYVHGLQITSSSSTGTVARNRIYNLTNQSTGAGATITGLNRYWGTFNMVNNQVTLTNGEPTTDISGSKSVNLDSKNSFLNNTNVKTAPVQTSPIQTQPVIEKKAKGEGSGISGNDKDKDKENNKYNDKDLNTANLTAITVNEELVNDNPPKPETVKDAFTTGTIIYGIYDDATVANPYYYNTIYVGGSANTGAANSYAFRKASPTHTLRNNLFINARTNGLATGKHYVVYSTSTTANSLNSNYNAYIGSDANTIGLWGTTDQTIAAWRTSMGTAGYDKQTWCTTTGDVVPSSLLNNIGSGNLNIVNSYIGSWIVSGKGIALTGQSVDFSGDTRVTAVTGGVTDIGSDEFSTPGMNPPAAIESAAPSGGTTTTYTLWNRTIATIDWGAGGSSYPSSITATYFSGVNPPSVLGGNYANSYASITATGTLVDATYDITFYFGDNETFTISAPSTNTVLSKYGTSWEVFPLGINPWQTQLTYNTGTSTFTAKVNGLWDFSNFALSDATSPLPVVISEFNVTASNRDANLRWITTMELNNRGFAVERRMKLSGEVTNYTEWKQVGFVDGNGTTNEPKTYNFSDKKLASATYQYRLKQVDFNNNFEYYTPSQSDIFIGKPGSFDISQNYPNPSNPKSKIDFQMPFDGKVSIKVYDILGQEVATLANEFRSADFYTVEFDGSNLASGTYFYRIIAEGNGQKFTKTLKMILVK